MSLTDEQKELRKKGLFASDVARIMTGNSVRVALEKMGELVDQGEGLDEVEEVQLGHIMEPRILDAYEQQYEPQQLIRSPGSMIHPEETWLGAHLDGLSIEDNGIIDVECKSVGWYNRKHWGDGGDEMPNKVLWQVIAQMAVARYQGHRVRLARIPVCFLDASAFMAYIFERPLPITVFEVEADEELEIALLIRCRKVWNNVQQGIIPLPENIEDVKLVYKKDEGLVVEADQEMLEQVVLHLKYKEALKRLEAEKSRCEFNIQTFMQAAAFLRFENRTIATWKNNADGKKFDEKAFANDNPDEHRLYMKTTTGARVFLTKEKSVKELLKDNDS